MVPTPDRRQSKTLLTIDERGSKIARNKILDCHFRQSGEELQSGTLFLTILNLRSSLVFTFLIATYPVWYHEP